MVYLSQSVDDVRVGDRVAARSIGLDDDRDLEVTDAYVDPDDPSGEMVYVAVDRGDGVKLGDRYSRSRVVRVVVPEVETAVTPEVRERCAARYFEADDDPEKIAALFGIELLSLQWRLTRGKPSPILVPVGWALGDPHPLDVNIEDVEACATGAIANIVVWLRGHGYDDQAIVARAIDYASGDLEQSGLNRTSREGVSE